MTPERVRLDQWLWAARFFRSRSLAKEAVEGGKVWYDGARTRASKEVRVGAELRIRQGFDEKTVIVQALSITRRGAPEAALLYSETAQSLLLRQAAAERRRLERVAGSLPPAQRPDKRARRMIHRFRERNES